MIRAAILPISSAFESGPKPAIASGALKSQSYSASPTKFLMLGSEAQVRRSAARVNSDGTPGARNPRMSVSAVIDSIGGRLARSNVGSTGAGTSRDKAAAGSGPAGIFAFDGIGTFADSVSRTASRLRRDQREMKPSESFIGPFPSRPVGGARCPPDQHGRADV